MANAVTKLAWHTIDATTLPVPIAKQYEAYKATYREMIAERKAFEDAFLAMLASAPATHPLHAAKHKRHVIGYNFGKLSVAIADDDGKASPTAKGTLSLASLAR